MSEFSDKFKATQLFDEIVWNFRANLPLKTNRHLISVIENSFVGKEAVDFLLQELPKIVPNKKLTRENVTSFLQMMQEWQIISDAMPRKSSKKQFQEGRIYLFSKSLSELRRPKRSRRSASFSGARKSSQISTSIQSDEISPVRDTLPRSMRMSRRLSRSNGNIQKLVDSCEIDEKKGHENPGFDENIAVEEKFENKDCSPEKFEKGKKDRNYDWLPFFKSKRFAAKQDGNKKGSRSKSLDRNYFEVGENASAPISLSPQPVAQYCDDFVVMHPRGKLSKELSRSRMYESIARRQGTSSKETMVWRTVLIERIASISGVEVPKNWAIKVDGNDVQWNSSLNNVDSIDGVVRSKLCGSQPDYPSTVVQFMEYLGKYPFSKRNELMSDEKVSKIFNTLANRLEDLNPPILPDETSFIVQLLSKLESFKEMLNEEKTNRMNANIPIRQLPLEAEKLMENFPREVPVCGIRASIHKRKTVLELKPVRCHLIINDEASYKLRESWLIEAIQLVLLALPTARRRKLHKFVLFMRSLATNELIDISDSANGSTNNREAVIMGLWTGICGGSARIHGILVTAVLLANHRLLFSIPDELADRVESGSSYEGVAGKYAKVIRGRKLNRVYEDRAIYGRFEKEEKKNERDEKKPSFLKRLLKN